MYASPERIVQIRENRLLGLNAHRDDDQYIDKAAVAEEVAYSRRLCAKHSWPIIDVTRRSIEETAAAVMRLLSERRRAAGGVGRETCMPLWLADQPLVLASKSDMRGKILAAAGLRFEIRPAQIDERAVEAEAGAARCGRRGARCWRAPRPTRWRANMPGRLVLGADQTLALGSERFSKPADRAEAAAATARLCAAGPTSCIRRWRWCATARCCSNYVDTARLTMRDFSDRFHRRLSRHGGRRGA